MNDISEDIKIVILTFLPPSSLYTVSLVSKEWAKLVDTEYIWKELSKPFVSPSHLEKSNEPPYCSTWKMFYKEFATSVTWRTDYNPRILVSKKGTFLTNTSNYTETIISNKMIPCTMNFYWEIRIPQKASWFCCGIVTSSVPQYTFEIQGWNWIGNGRRGEYGYSNDAQIFDNGQYLSAIRYDVKKHVNPGDTVSFWIYEKKFFIFLEARNIVWFRLREEDKYIFPAVTLYLSPCSIDSSPPYLYKHLIWKNYGKRMMEVDTHTPNKVNALDDPVMPPITISQTNQTVEEKNTKPKQHTKCNVT